MDLQPLVSVLMTAYNRERYIAEAIESVLASTYVNFELIIVDDKSTDNTVSIARRFEAMDSRIRVYINEKNLGQFGNRNRAASFANGEFIKYLDSDDVMQNDMVEVMVKGMSRFPEAGIGAICDWEKLNQHDLPVQFTSREAYINHYFGGCSILYVGPSGAIYKKKLFIACGGFNETIGILADTLLSFQLAAVAKVVAFKANLFIWRLHDEQVTEGQRDFFEMFKARYHINEIVLTVQTCPFNKEEIALVKRNLKNIFLRKIVHEGFLIKSPYKMFYVAKLYGITFMDVIKSVIPNRSMDVSVGKTDNFASR